MILACLSCLTLLTKKKFLGIGPRRQEISETRAFISVGISILDSFGHRRALSLGPGINYTPDNLEEVPQPATDRTLTFDRERMMGARTSSRRHPTSDSTMTSRHMRQTLSEDHFSAPLPPYPSTASSDILPIPEGPGVAPEGPELGANGQLKCHCVNPVS